MKTLLLVDASSYLYRAYHALPDLRTKSGEPSGAIFGVINMLRRLTKDVPADYLACVFDAKGKTFRDDWYPEYKAKRSPMPDDLARQTEPLHETIRALGWPVIVEPGVEADDVIATLARQAEREGLRILISSGDKDLSQLVSSRVTVVNTMTNETLDRAGVEAKFGVPPERIVDYLTLIGDAVDNVPGVEKVGPKTAVKLLNEFGSLDELVARAGEVKGAVGDNLRRALDWLPTARRLLTVRDHVPLSEGIADLVPAAPDTGALRSLFNRFEFRSWLRELDAAAGAPAQAAPADSPRAYETVLTAEQLAAWAGKLATAPLICVDTETTGLDPMTAQLVGISLAVAPHAAAYVPIHHRYTGAPPQLKESEVLDALRPLLEDPDRPKLGQNLKYDMHIFANHGVNVTGVAHDTLLQDYVLESHKAHDMDSMASRHLNEKTVSYAEVCGKGVSQIDFDQVDVATATCYSAEDADVTLRLHEALFPRVGADAKLAHVYRDIEMPLLPVIFRMERHGVLLDTTKLDAQSKKLGEAMLELEARAHEAAGGPFNLGSPRQIGEILFTRLQLPVVKKTATGQPSTDEDVLSQLALDYPLPKLILDYRGLAKLKSTYTDKLPRMVNARTGRVHTSYNQAVAVTGRLASSDPNLQNIPVRTPEGRRIREAFIARPGHAIVSADYSQIELRIMAHLSGDDSLLDAFRHDRDIHRATAAEIFGIDVDAVNANQRRVAKTINFGLIYGMSEFGLAIQLGLERAAARAYIDRYFARYPGVAAYMERTRGEARARGWVETVFGRRLWLPEINAGNGQRRQAAERAAINAPMQGTAADLIKLAMIAVDRWIAEDKCSTGLIMQVHDELVLEVPASELDTVRHRLPALMCNVAELRVPLKVEIGTGRNWDEAH